MVSIAKVRINYRFMHAINAGLAFCYCVEKWHKT